MKSIPQVREKPYETNFESKIKRKVENIEELMFFGEDETERVKINGSSELQKGRKKYSGDFFWM